MKQKWNPAYRKPVPKADAIWPDGVPIEIDWEQFRPGASVFVPCIDTSTARRQIRKLTKQWGWTMEYKLRAENGYWGVRVWRVS